MVSLATNPTYSLCIAIYIPPMAIVLHCITKKGMKTVMTKMKAVQEIGGFMQETLSTMKLIVSFGREEHRKREFLTLLNKTRVVNENAACVSGVVAASFFTIALG